MTTRITRMDDQIGDRTTLKVEGSLFAADAEVLERTYESLPAGDRRRIAIDLTNISFLDTESASVLCRLRRLGVELVGLHLFVQRIIELADSSAD